MWALKEKGSIEEDEVNTRLVIERRLGGLEVWLQYEPVSGWRFTQQVRAVGKYGMPLLLNNYRSCTPWWSTLYGIQNYSSCPEDMVLQWLQKGASHTLGWEAWLTVP